MIEVTVKQYANVLGISPERLTQQLASAGIDGKKDSDILLENEKRALLNYLRQSHGAKEPNASTETAKKITLKKRKTTTTLKQQGPSVRTRVKSKVVNVEIRKKKKVATSVALKKKSKEADADKLAKEKQLKEKRWAEELELQKLEDERKKIQVDKLEQEKAKKEQKSAEAVQPPQITTPKPDKKPVARRKHKPEKKRKEPAFKRKELHVKQRTGRTRNKPVVRERKKVETTTEHGFTKPTEPVIREVPVPESITVGDLAQKMSVKAGDLLKTMMNNCIMATINQTIDHDTAYLLVEEMGHKPVKATDTSLEDEVLKEETIDQTSLKPRAPVVTVMGHVDHGKTSLLDYIRKSQVTKSEAGGITQHVGAYKVNTKYGEITFMDTPGHAAFTAMRARGAKVTDMVIIVVAADDGVMPQTIESIEHAKAAKVAIIVAVNKIDKEEADPDKIKNAMAKYDIIPEDWGGNVPFVNVSAHTGDGISELLETISLHAEILELKAVDETPARGSVIESRIDKGYGAVSTVIVQSGTLKKGDILLAGKEFGRARRMMDEKDAIVDKAGPSTPVQILGLSGCPEAGEVFAVVEHEKIARELVEERRTKSRELKLAQQKQASLDRMFDQMQEGGLEEINILVKADVHGSAEAIKESLQNLSNEEVKVNVVAAGVGGINESDVNLALASNAILVGFNVRADASAKKLIKSENVELNYYSIIYDLIDTVKALIAGSMEPEFKEQIIGVAEVRDVFKAPKIGAVAGCMVTEGIIKHNNPIRVLRDNVVIFEGELESLRRFKDDVKEVKSGTECGIGVKSYNDVKAGDQIEVFERVEVKRKIK